MSDIPDDITIPTAFCPTCDDTGPVVIEDMSSEIGENFVAIFCPGCESVLNLNGSVEVNYFDPEDLERAFGWKLSDNAD